MAETGGLVNGRGEAIREPHEYFRAVAEDRYGYNERGYENARGEALNDHEDGGYSDGGYDDGCYSDGGYDSE